MEHQLSTSVRCEPECLHRPVVIPWLRGWVYLESRLPRASVNGPISDDLESCLLRAPGVALRRGRPLLESVDAADWWTRPREDC